MTKLYRKECNVWLVPRLRYLKHIYWLALNECKKTAEKKISGETKE